MSLKSKWVKTVKPDQGLQFEELQREMAEENHQRLACPAPAKYEGHDSYVGQAAPKAATQPGSPKYKDSPVMGVLVAIVICAYVAVRAYNYTHFDSNYSPQPAVTQSSWDGSVWQVKDYLKTHANDPSSLQFVRWSLTRKPSGFSEVKVEYRAKNGFGALMLYDGDFVLDSAGRITDADAGQN